MLWGAIIGDIVGSVYEFHNIKTKDFPLFDRASRYTDDTVMTIAIAHAICSTFYNFTDFTEEVIKSIKYYGKIYPRVGYGRMFLNWLFSKESEPYNSWGNGAAMRVSACGWAGSTIEKVKTLSYKATAVTHNHPEGIKGAEATAIAVFLARTGYSKEDIKKYITKNYYDIDFTLDEIRPEYRFHVSCQNSVPQALEAFFESTSFEDAIRNAISIGGDSDTIGAITGAVAEAYYGVPEELMNTARNYIPEDLLEVINKFDNMFQTDK